MIIKENQFVQNVRFLINQDSTFRELAEIARDMAGQNLPILVYSSDTLARKWYTELVAFLKFKKLNKIEFFYCSEKSRDLLQLLSQVPEETVLFWDGIEKLSIDIQTELLALIEKGYFQNKKQVFVAGTGENLDSLVEKGEFLEKLAFRLGLLKCNLPSLNEMKAGIVPLAKILLNICKSESGKNIQGFAADANQSLTDHFWKGGMLELKSCVLYAASVCKSDQILKGDLPFESGGIDDTNAAAVSSLGEDKTMKTALDSFKRYYVIKILEENDNNQTKAAKVLGLQRTYVSRLLNELHIRK